MKLCKGDGSVFESQDLFKYMYSIKFSNRTHTIQLVIETLNKYSAAIAEKKTNIDHSGWRKMPS